MGLPSNNSFFLYRFQNVTIAWQTLQLLWRLNITLSMFCNQLKKFARLHRAKIKVIIHSYLVWYRDCGSQMESNPPTRHCSACLGSIQVIIIQTTGPDPNFCLGFTLTSPALDSSNAQRLFRNREYLWSQLLRWFGVWSCLGAQLSLTLQRVDLVWFSSFRPQLFCIGSGRHVAEFQRVWKYCKSFWKNSTKSCEKKFVQIKMFRQTWLALI